jgi:hypothetical protein
MFIIAALFVCLFIWGVIKPVKKVSLFVWGVNKASQEGALQRHPGIDFSFNIPMYGGYDHDLGCHRRFPSAVCC